MRGRGLQTIENILRNQIPLVYMAPDGSLEVWTKGPWHTLDQDEGTWKRQRDINDVYGRPLPYVRCQGAEDCGDDEEKLDPTYWGRELLGPL